MNLIQITPGAGGMYCGNCFRDNALVAELRRQGHDTVMVPLYLPMTLDEAPTVGATPTFFGGINVFLSQKLAWYRRAPAWMRRAADAPWLLKWAAGKTAKILKVIDEIVPEPPGGAHRDYDTTMKTVKKAVARHLHKLAHLPPKKLVARRYEKYAAIGRFR